MVVTRLDTPANDQCKVKNVTADCGLETAAAWKKTKTKSKMETANYIMLTVAIVCTPVRLNITMPTPGSFSNKPVTVNPHPIDTRDTWGMGEALWGLPL